MTVNLLLSGTVAVLCGLYICTTAEDCVNEREITLIKVVDSVYTD